MTERLPSEPLREWLGHYLEVKGLWSPEQRRLLPGASALAHDWGIDRKRLYEVMVEAKPTCTLTLADKLLTRSGNPHLLYELYGAQLDERVAA